MKMPRIVHVEPPEGPSEYDRLRAEQDALRKLLHRALPYIDSFPMLTKHPTAGGEAYALAKQIRSSLTVAGSPK